MRWLDELNASLPFCVTEWQVVRLIGSFFLVGVKIEHARFDIDLAVFKSSGVLQYGNSK